MGSHALSNERGSITIDVLDADDGAFNYSLEVPVHGMMDMAIEGNYVSVLKDTLGTGFAFRPQMLIGMHSRWILPVCGK